MIKITNENIEIYRKYYKTFYSIRFTDSYYYYLLVVKMNWFVL